MISLRLLSVHSKRVRALTAGAFFLLIVPQKIQSIEPITAGITAVVIGAAYCVAEFFSPSPTEPKKSGSKFDPNCSDCIKAVKSVSTQKYPPTPITTTAKQMPKTEASQIVYHHHTTTHNTTITADTGNTIHIITSNETDPAPPAPVQNIKAIQEVKPTQHIKVTEPKNSPIVSAPTPKSATLSDQADSMRMAVYDRVQDLYTNHYGKVGLATAATGYVYILYVISSLQRYLLDPKRVSLWFSQYDLNQLLLLDLDKMQELLVQEFISTYNVADQKSLKPAVSSFLEDIETELASLERYQTLSGRIGTVSTVVEKCCTPVTDIARSVIPFAGIALDYIPMISINSIFFVNATLKTTIQERISRVHYYKNIFLQSTIVV
jgi:hypothetical protein